MSQNSNSSATGSALMRLPAEIRRMILRMVIGDNLIHIYDCDRGNGYIDESAPGDDSECILTHRVCHSGSTVPISAILNFTSSFDLAHRNCADLHEYRRDNYLDFRVFETSRQIYQEAFSLFWRTSRFAFEQGDVFTTFLGYLSEAQRHNLQNIVICHRFRSFSLYPEYYQAYQPLKLVWASCFTDQEIFSSLRSLKNIEIHLDLCRHGDDIDYLRTFRTQFKAFEPLRLLSLDEASITVAVSDEMYRTPIQLKDEDRISLTRSFRARLVKSTRTTQDMADILQDEMGALKFSERVSETKVKASEWKIKDLLREVAEIQAEADQHQIKVNEDRDDLQRLQTVLSRNEPSEMDKEVQRRTGEYLEL